MLHGFSVRNFMASNKIILNSVEQKTHTRENIDYLRKGHKGYVQP